MSDDDFDNNMPSVPTDTGETETGAVSATDAVHLVADEPQAQPAVISPKQEALRGLPPEWREQLIEQASAMGISAPDDIAWLLVKSFINAWAGAAASTNAAERIEVATRGIADQIYQTTVRAGADLKGVIDTDIRKGAVDVGRATVKAIMVSITQGAEKLQEVAADLDKIAQEKGAQFAASWRAQAARAGEEQARAALQKAIAIRWGVVATTIAVSMVVGVILATEFIDLTGHLLPWADHLATVNGRPDCGFAKALGGRVCGVN